MPDHKHAGNLTLKKKKKGMNFQIGGTHQYPTSWAEKGPHHCEISEHGEQRRFHKLLKRIRSHCKD